MAKRPTEIRLVASMLEQPADSTLDLAESIITALDEDRMKRQRYVLAMSLGGATLVFGPYETVGEAKRELGRKAIKVSDEQQFRIYKMFQPGEDVVT